MVHKTVAATSGGMVAWAVTTAPLRGLAAPLPPPPRLKLDKDDDPDQKALTMSAGDPKAPAPLRLKLDKDGADQKLLTMSAGDHKAVPAAPAAAAAAEGSAAKVPVKGQCKEDLDAWPAHHVVTKQAFTFGQSVRPHARMSASVCTNRSVCVVSGVREVVAEDGG